MPRSGAARAWRRVGRRPPALAGGAVVILLLVAASLAPLLAPHDPIEQALGPGLTPPGRPFLLGLDSLGRDVASRLIYGSRISLLVGAITVSIAFTVGLALGVLAGYYGGQLDRLVMRACDAVFSFPPVLLAMALIAALGPNIRNVMIALGIVYTPRYIRLVRVGVLAAREQEYVAAAVAAGARDGRILRLHVLPNILGPVVVQTSFSFGEAIIAEAALSFLGIGTQPPTPSWGLMLSEARDYLAQAAWYPGIVGCVLFLVVLAINLVGDSLRDALDPRSTW
ncbi:MAG: ABC transporter permease [Candidatus Rokubacteria bacterium]|nr:ABC transporter permease [Candidatus Rokubacteria bacterium]MBI3826756.1 ABC transporter permease [Candidatus Rokubacteria bacterium]